eukprot:SAG31_NODE_12056_length_973_cov_0.869565_2_plen_134_part_00
MLAEVASMYAQGVGGPRNATRATQLANLSNTVGAAVLERLYVQGKGYWACEYPSGKRVEVRSVVDFTTIAQAIPSLLSTLVRAEMSHFVQEELETPHWMRALSMNDSAAPYSDRKDHGPYGSWDGWLGETVEA